MFIECHEYPRAPTIAVTITIVVTITIAVTITIVVTITIAVTIKSQYSQQKKSTFY